MNIKTSNLFQVSVTTGWVALPSRSASNVSIENNTGADLLVRTERDQATEYNTIATGKSVGVPVVGNSSEVLIKAAVGASGINVVTFKVKE